MQTRLASKSQANNGRASVTLDNAARFHILTGAGTISGIAHMLGVNKSHVWKYKKHGIEPVDNEIRSRMGLPHKITGIPPELIGTCETCHNEFLKKHSRKKFCDHKCRAKEKRRLDKLKNFTK